jgi:rhodanese-related sulfurtransferase
MCKSGVIRQVDQIIEFISNNWMLAAAWTGLVIMLILSFTNSSSKVIGCQEITRMINREQAKVIDIRSKADFNKGHLLGSVNIPAAQIKDAGKELEKYQQHPIILVDATGMHAAATAQELLKMGISKVNRMQGGIISWTNDNLPLTKP